MLNSFYTYLYLRKIGTPYYVGKGYGRRAFAKATRRFAPPPRDQIIIQEFESEQDAFEAERFLISYYGRIDLGTGCLRNLSNGGEGSSGWNPPLEWIEKARVKMLGNTRTLGYKHTPESRRKMSLAGKGKKHWWGAKIGAAQIGNQRGKKNKGIVFTLEWRRNLSLAQQRRYARPTNS